MPDFSRLVRAFRTVKVRLTLWYALMLTLLLTLFGIFMVTEFSRVLFRDVDKNLETEARLISESLSTYLETLPKSAFAGNRIWSDSEARQTLENWESASLRLRKSPSMINIVRANHFGLLDNLTGWQHEIIFPNFERDSIFMEKGISYQIIHFQKKPVRLYYRRFYFPGLNSIIIQCGGSLEEARKALDRLSWILWIAVPGAVAAACVVGWFLVKRSLQPVDAMIGQARQITAAYLQTRLPRTQVRDELDRLAETLNEMMDRIEVSTRSVREFSSDVSHELKTPLAIIKGEIDLALRRTRSPEALTETLKTIGGEVDEMIRLVDDLMLLVRSDARQLKFEKRPVSLAGILTQVGERFKDRLAKKEIRFNLTLPEDIEILGDDVYLKRLFSNLLDNGIKFTPARGQIDITLSRKVGGAEIQVIDNGIGIEPDAQLKVFSRFYRTDQARSYEGAGLGLNIARTISDAHQGTLTLKSSPGTGTVITVFLPFPTL